MYIAIFPFEIYGADIHCIASAVGVFSNENVYYHSLVALVGTSSSNSNVKTHYSQRFPSFPH